MTQPTAIWIRCPKCFHSTLIDANLEVDKYTSRCKCGISLNDMAKEGIKDYVRFVRLIYKKDESKHTHEELNELMDLYSKVVKA